MYWASLLFLRWIGFWRLPETEQTRRIQSQSYLRRVEWLKNSWIVLLIGLLLSGQLFLLIFGVILMTFVSFMFLDET